MTLRPQPDRRGETPQAPPEIALPVAQAIAKKLRAQVDALNTLVAEARRLGLDVDVDETGSDVVSLTIFLKSEPV